jgi:hypothetical protein
VSTLKVAAINNPSASTGGLAISSAGLVTGAGLDLIVTQSFSAASSVSLNNCFSADYDNYQIAIQFSSVSADVDIFARMRATSTDASGANYATQYTLSVSTTVSASLAGGNTNFYFYGADIANGSRYAAILDVFRPFAASPTSIVANISGTNGVGALGTFSAAGHHSLSTSYDGFSLLPSGGNITGTIAVYGSKK